MLDDGCGPEFEVCGNLEILRAAVVALIEASEARAKILALMASTLLFNCLGFPYSPSLSFICSIC